MTINISYISTKYYDRTSIMQWMWWFEKYTYIKGFKMRIFGVYINVREKDALNKLIRIAKEHNERKAKNITGISKDTAPDGEVKPV